MSYRPYESGVPVRKIRIAIQGLAIAGGWAPIAIAAGQSVAIRVDDFEASTAAQYSLIIALGWLVQMIALPAMGRVSDISAQRGISRRALLVFGALGAIAASVLLQITTTVPAFTVVWVLAQVPAALVITVAATNLAAESHGKEQGWASGIAGMAFALSLLVGAITALATSSSSELLFIAPSIIGAILVIPALFLKTLESEPSPPALGLPSITRPWVLLAVIALVFSGVAVGRIYAVPLIEEIGTALSNKEVTDSSSYALIAATLLAFVGNIVAGKIIGSGRSSTRVLALFCFIAAVPLVGFSVVQTIPQFIATAGFLGFAIGAVTSSAYAVYLTYFADRGDAGRNFGLLTAAETIPYVIIPLIAAATQESLGNTVLTGLFLAGAALASCAGILAYRSQNIRRRLTSCE